MEQLIEKFAEWSNFTNTREAERVKAMHPGEADELRQQIKEAQAAVQTAQAHLQSLKAQYTLSGVGGMTYRKAAFDMDWSQRKLKLKDEVENLIAEQLQAGVSIPKIMKKLGSKNPVWFYTIKDNLSRYRGAAKEDMAHTTWEWSDATSVHRYGLGRDLETNEWAFVLMHGAPDSPFENEKCTFDFNTGHFIGGNHDLFGSVAVGARKQRALMLAEILDGTYTKKIRRDTNPYFQTK